VKKSTGSYLQYEDANCQNDSDTSRERGCCTVCPLCAEDEVDDSQEDLHCRSLRIHSITSIFMQYAKKHHTGLRAVARQRLRVDFSREALEHDEHRNGGEVVLEQQRHDLNESIEE